MKNFAKVIKTVAAAVAATALLPFGLLVAEAAPSDQYAVVRGVECVIGINGVSTSNYRNLSTDEYTIAIKAPANGSVYAYCQNGQGNVPFTSSPKVAGADFFLNPTSVDPYFTTDRMPAASAQKPAAQPVKKVVLGSSTPAGSNAVAVAQAPQTQTSSNKTTEQVVRNDGKVTATTTPSVDNAPAAVNEATDSADVTAEENMGTVSRDVETEKSATVNTDAASATTSDNVVDAQQIEASDYASANLSLVDRMGGAGTLVGIVILGLVGAAGAISLARSIILG